MLPTPKIWMVVYLKKIAIQQVESWRHSLNKYGYFNPVVYCNMHRKCTYIADIVSVKWKYAIQMSTVMGLVVVYAD